MNSPFVRQYYLIVFLLFLFSLIMSVMPLPNSLLLWRPQWVFLAVICLALEFPTLLSLVSVWFIGLFLDLLVSDVVGVHAIIFATVFFLIRRLHRWLSGLPLWQMAIVVCVLLIGGMLTQALLHALVGITTHFWVLCLSIFSNVWVWLLMYITVVRYKKRYQIVY